MRIVSFAVLVPALASFVAACADGTSSDASGVTAATEEDYDNTATTIAGAIAHEGNEVGPMRAAAAIARGEMPEGMARESDGSFKVNDAGIEHTFAVSCHGTARAATACDGDTAAADVTAAWTGSFDLPHLSMSVAHDARWTLTAMTDDIARVDGTGHLVYETRDSVASFRYEYDATYRVTVNDQRAIDGEMELAITAEHRNDEAQRKFEIEAKLRFLPDDTAELVLDGTRRYRIWMATAEVKQIEDTSIAMSTLRSSGGRG